MIILNSDICATIGCLGSMKYLQVKLCVKSTWDETSKSEGKVVVLVDDCIRRVQN